MVEFVCGEHRARLSMKYCGHTILAIATALSFFLVGCSTTNAVRESDTGLSAALLAPIHDEALTLVRKYQTSPMRAARMLAYLDSAVLETSRRNAKASGCEHLMYALASYSMLSHFFPLETPGRLLSIPRLMPEWNAASCVEPRRLAEVAAEATIARAMRDGANPPKKIRAHPGREVGLWEPTPPLFSANPIEPYAGEWTTMVIGNPSQLRLPPPPSAQSADYQKGVEEAFAVAAKLSAAEKEIAEKWNLSAGSVTPAGVWNMRLHKIVGEERLTNQQTIEIFSAVHIAMHDALIACSYAKYLYWTERPITVALRLGKSEFKPTLVTPSFPAYPSGHACMSGAAARVIAVYLPGRTAEVIALANEAAKSRVYGGIHFPSGNVSGRALGQCVGSKVIERVLGGTAH